MISVEDLNARHGTSFAFVGAYAGGEVGAVRLVDAHGKYYVLKNRSPGLAPVTTDALRPLGYPVSRYVVWGDDYHVQEELPGRPAGGWGVAEKDVMARLLVLNELQSDIAVDDDTSWPATIVESVTAGFAEFCVVDTLVHHSDESRELLCLCRSAVERYASGLTGRRDVVHMDFTLANVLVDRGAVTGVIDWGGTRSGDRLFDLATLVYYARELAPEIETYVVQRIGREGLAVYLAHMAIRQTDWSLRHHGPGGEHALRYSLGIARDFPSS